ncbi:MAG: NAD/NADP octopine/nopaline dehydrogenase family protein [Nitrososphaerales archaeon]
MNTTVSKITIVGAGGGGSACAVGLRLRGFDVSLFSRNLASRPRLGKNREIEYRGDLGDGIISVNATDNIRDAIHEAELILVIVPAFAQSDIASLLFEHVKRKQIIVFAPGACASLECRLLLQRIEVVGELLTIPYGGRIQSNEILDVSAPMLERGKVMRTASFPGSEIGKIVDTLKGVLETKQASNVVETGILNPSSITHPSIMLFNLGSFERKDPNFSELNDGLTSASSNLIEDLDSEKMNVCKSLNVASPSIAEVFGEFASRRLYTEKERSLTTSEKVYSVQRRFVEEDVPFGLVLISSLAKLANTKTPLIDSAVRIFSSALNVDLISTGRNLKSMGVSGLSVDQLSFMLNNGPR